MILLTLIVILVFARRSLRSRVSAVQGLCVMFFGSLAMHPSHHCSYFLGPSLHLFKFEIYHFGTGI